MHRNDELIIMGKQDQIDLVYPRLILAIPPSCYYIPIMQTLALAHQR